MSSPDSYLSPHERDLWRGFLAWSESVTASVARALTERSGLSVPEFEILVRLWEAPGHSLGQQTLGDSLSWSASRLSHQLSRMDKRALLSRKSAGSGRYMIVRLTPAGADAARRALHVHAEAVRAFFLAPLNDTQRSALASLPASSAPADGHAARSARQ
ncbi:MarR family winged helix-turn-helix transcriptional regulator [Streptomyces peucetius]|uniref:MarR family winged helix-turn-helix transcriptional regulator n=1 Tax=Streptomyces peucetius TaxID=1950 RepID=A0ABY6IKA3_STRPE|nr:MarR family winged helix-turn-helix transcriptional regulator [Streptomyces peucetius]UYQ66322.1 MarR family winged helix-turn-helix transcriptional regulator [Streptomyces peucetius]